MLLYITLALALIASFAVQRYLDSPLGHMLKAIKSNETRLEYLGVSARKMLLIGYIISAFLGGLGGALVTVAQQIATPEFAFWTKSGEFVFIAILGERPMRPEHLPGRRCSRSCASSRRRSSPMPGS